MFWEGGLRVSLSAKKPRSTRGKRRVRISSDGRGPKSSTPNLTPQQISVIAGLLAGFFEIESVLYSRDNVLQVLLTTDKLTDLPILGPPTGTIDNDANNIVVIRS
ncbi:hypothetical protein D3C76_788710 [compost metagenome]